MATAFAQAEVFGEQVTTNSLAQNIVYVSGTVGALVILAGLLMVDMGGVRRRNVFDSVIQKLIGFFIGFVVYFLIGFAIWNWQYYVAFDIPDPYWQSVKDWWLGGSLQGSLAQTTDPAVAPGLNNQQIFIFFLACFAGIINVLIGIALTERIKPSAYFVTSAVCAVVSSLLSWLTWGSTGPLTNEGYHDFFGAGFVYVFAGSVALVMVRAVGTRVGMYRPHPRAGEYRSYNLGLTTIGLVMIIGGLPFVILSCGFFFAPEALFVGVNMSDTSIGVAFNNLGLVLGGRRDHGRAHRLQDEEVHLHAARAVRGLRDRHARVRHLRAVGDAAHLDGGAVRGLRDLRVAAEARDRRAQADPAVRRGRLRGHPAGRRPQLGHGRAAATSA